MSLVKVTKPVNAVTKFSRIYGTGRSMNFKLGIRMEYDDRHHQRLKAQGE